MADELFKDSERAKYERVWGQLDSYRDQCDGEPAMARVHSKMGFMPGDSLIDWGCGKGTCSYYFTVKDMNVTAVDIAHNCLEPKYHGAFPLVVACIWEAPPELRSDWAFCTDVLEHIPADYIGACLDIIRARTRKGAFIQIDTVLDTSGPKMNPPEVLHLCVRDKNWWREELLKRWGRVDDEPGYYTRWRYYCTV